MHVFHTTCYEESMDGDSEHENSAEAMINKCPTCQVPMNITLSQDDSHRFSINNK